MHNVWRVASMGLGIVTALLGMFGAYQFGLKLEGGVSYLTIAAPVIAMAAALIPPLAEHAWRQKQYAKSLFWWAVLIPAAATVFFGAAERMHTAKAGAQAERHALRQEAARADKELIEAKEEARKAEVNALKAEARKTSLWSAKKPATSASMAWARSVRAPLRRTSVSGSANSPGWRKVTTVPSFMAYRSFWTCGRFVTATDTPPPLSRRHQLSRIALAFMAIWTGLTGPKAEAVKAKRPSRRRKPKVKARAVPKPVLIRPTDADHLRLAK